MYFGNCPTFRKHESPSSKKPAEASGKPVKVTSTNIPTNSMAGQLEDNMGKHVALRSVQFDEGTVGKDG
jgi:hypothetical protein